MSQDKSAEQIKNQHLEQMGVELGTIFNFLYNEVLTINYKWTEYIEVYGTNEERLKLLNKTAPTYFAVVQKVLFENIVLNIARITDPIQSMGKKNLTIKAIPQFITDDNLKARILKCIDEIDNESSFCRDWRNRLITHSDYSLLMNEKAQPLEPANRTKIDSIIKLLYEFINELYDKYFNTRIYEKIIKANNGVFRLLCLLDEGQTSEHDRIQRIKSGNYFESDRIRRTL